MKSVAPISTWYATYNLTVQGPQKMFALANSEAQEIKAQCALRRLDMPPLGIR